MESLITRREALGLAAVAVPCAAVALVPQPAYAQDGSLVAAKMTAGKTSAADEPVEVVYSGVTVRAGAKMRGAGWTGWVAAGKTIGKAKGAGLTSFRIELKGLQGLGGHVCYQVYKRGAGWQKTVCDSAATVEAANVEGIKIRLTGEVAKHYDVLYRSYMSGKGCGKWVKNGSFSGLVGKGSCLTALQVKLSPKTEEAAGKSTGKVGVRYGAYVRKTGWQEWVGDGATSGVPGKSLPLGGLSVMADSGSLSGSVEVRSCVGVCGWGAWIASGGFSGATNHDLEALCIRLTGKLASKYDVYYRAYVVNYGWLDWAKNGAAAGSTGFGLWMEGLQVKLVKKGGKAPGSTNYPTVNKLEKKGRLDGIDISSWQKGINIHKVSADFVIVKATESTDYTNPYFRKWADQVLASGKQLGIYHFATDDASAYDQADFFYETVKPYIGKAVLFLDWENASRKEGTYYSDVLSKGPSFAKRWLDRVYKKTGVKPLIYMSQSVTWNYDWSAVAKRYKLWLAQYLYANEYSNGYLNGVTHWSINHWKSATIYQYSSTAKISGYGNRLDVNKFYGSVADWKRLARKS